MWSKFLNMAKNSNKNSTWIHKRRPRVSEKEMLHGPACLKNKIQ